MNSINAFLELRLRIGWIAFHGWMGVEELIHDLDGIRRGEAQPAMPPDGAIVLEG
jgi:hypothetical protein